jgi:uncharacterized protein (TIGR02996 family)
MEAALLQAIRESPAEEMNWRVLGDWLEDLGDTRADLVRLRLELLGPRLKPDARLALVRQQTELLRAGVRPCVPTLVNSLGMEFVLVPPGGFFMGSSEDEEGRYEDEGPRHLVRITRPFWLGRYTVTQGQYARLIGGNPSYFTSARMGEEADGDPTNLPVERVTWYEAVEFCEAMSRASAERKAGRKYRLPTEAEWEYACRAGSEAPFGYGAELTSALANFDGTKPYGSREKGKHLRRTTLVGSYPPNAWGLYDMHGNVWEWCSDWFERDYYANSPTDDPTGPEEGAEKVLRGGSYYYIGSSCRAAIRLDREPEARSNLDGFRVAIDWAG